ncbi:phosphatidylserine decarboxylase, putative [Syntrophotalea carbinolica DSM 2380]|uniref:Phosphatidylserine decarboxylase, putative n=1 Tax=Syntrophotalea carbinolica (strain DSM 2380 / NBRC 103641 / GraBd1) TaxID=338963 RepID=Q3A267_SYNC1|nr:phosphatidylserine decarboxylase [Syntrophotalea carbinolica]ABA89540.1 phosphatidylserine decarboxylase, putative [Syntrophotalea carbinolica DSM 2380]
MAVTHQYVERETGNVRTEQLFGDRLVRFLYHPLREHAHWLFRAFTGGRCSAALALFNYDLALGCRVLGNRGFLQESGLDLRECLDPVEQLDTARKVFERKIRYWECRPVSDEPRAVLSPADARMLVGSFRENGQLFLKDKFFDFEELLGRDRIRWQKVFAGGDYAIFRLTPDKYHYNHTPVCGRVIDFYELDGVFHSCNPQAVVQAVTPYSKNRRVVTVFDTDVPGGTGVGLVAMIEVVALMIGEVVQCYSDHAYNDPIPVRSGLSVTRGRPKSLFRPGSSTDVLIFETGRVRFDEDLLRNQGRCQVSSRFSQGFGRSLVETEVQVRSRIAMPADV